MSNTTNQIKVTLLVTLENPVDTDSAEMKQIVEDVTNGHVNQNIYEIEMVEWQPSDE